ncbi:MAG TPA: TA system VapC family ribonuclease toxin [Thermoanaerobaculia bacterium]|nr:TA system VapC family ribonuclease toxin [Thermoanaerobaculia bacterium]
MLIDANLLLYAVDQRSRHHARARAWLTEALNGDRRVALPWLSLAAFVRIMTNPRASDRPLSAKEAWSHVSDWLDCDLTWTPGPTDRHAAVLGDLIVRYDLRANKVTDAQIAALAIEHGLTVCSSDTDFARFAEIEWVNPLS